MYFSLMVVSLYYYKPGVALIMLLLLVTAAATGQEYMYVNTDNLVLRDRPEKVYNVFAILHAPCKVKVDAYEDGYKNEKAVTDRFYQVSVSYDEGGIHHEIGGWVIKKYLVKQPRQVSARGVAINDQISAPAVMPELCVGRDEQNPLHGNAREYQAPVYKGGEPQPLPFKKIYHTGPRGGCYYINSKGRKEYVDSRFCGDKTK